MAKPPEDLPMPPSHECPANNIEAPDAGLYGPLRDWIANSTGAAAAFGRGDIAPNFILPDENAQLVSLRRLLEDGPVVLNFLTGGWCSPCISALRALHVALRNRAVRLVAITPETRHHPREMKAQSGLDCTVLCDVDYGVGLVFGLVFVAPPQILVQLAARGINLSAIHGHSKPMLMTPAIYVIGRSGSIRLVTIDTEYAGQPDTKAVLAALASDLAS
jgi:peroxiredoxin